MKSFLVVLLILACCTAIAADVIPSIDFTQPSVVAQWKMDHDVSALKHTSEGMEITISGGDPYISGPSVGLPPGMLMWAEIRLKTALPGSGQLFFFPKSTGANEADSVKFPVSAGDWQTVRVPLPPLGSDTVFRLDPPGTRGTVTVSGISFSERVLLKEPDWPKPEVPSFTGGSVSLTSGNLVLTHATDRFGLFTLSVFGKNTALGLTSPVFGYFTNGNLRWQNADSITGAKAEKTRDGIRVTATLRDADGARWNLDQDFRSDAKGGISVRSSVQVDADREVVFLPLFMLFPGAGSFGESKTQAMFAGLEYLGENEPSSSEKDIVGPQSRRQVPDNVKMTFPLMTVCSDGRYVALAWKRDDRFSAVFDSPDRLFHSGGHVMGVIFPGSNGMNRVEGNLLPYKGELLKAGETLTLSASLTGGSGTNAVPAVKDYVQRYGLPPLPPSGSWDEYAKTATAGWLDSGIRVGDRYRHAWPGGFGDGPAADAALWMDYLAALSQDSATQKRLKQAAKGAVALVPPDQLHNSGVGHIRTPAAALIYRQASTALDSARAEGHGFLKRFQSDGDVLYNPPADGMDLSTTNPGKATNGLTASVLTSLLERAQFTGDAALRKAGLDLLKKLERYDGSVPRGAQPWEVPLHTPDILASAYLAHAYIIGYELPGDRQFLDRAVYWAWTGVPFVYLASPTQPVGDYATIPVFGATYWTGSWFGLPVQWCGLVYADVLYRLNRYDKNVIWKRLADGIAISGVQQTCPIGEDDRRQGLLPDSFQLRTAIRNDVHINPATLQSQAILAFGKPAVHDTAVFFKNGATVHAPGGITRHEDTVDRCRFTVNGWSKEPYQIVVTGIARKPRVLVGNKPVSLTGVNTYDVKTGVLVLTLKAKASVLVQTSDSE